jgi:hypothetical protein
MVFCDEPWYNEPGRESQPNAAQSKAYNATIRSYTVQHAMLHWLNAQKADDGASKLWAEVVGKHFGAKAQAILATVKSWRDETLTLSPHLASLQAGLLTYGA